MGVVLPPIQHGENVPPLSRANIRRHSPAEGSETCESTVAKMSQPDSMAHVRGTPHRQGSEWKVGKRRMGLGLTTSVAMAGRSAAETPGGRAVATMEPRVSEFRLPNGMRFLVLERRNAPVVSFHTYADVGAADEDVGSTGLAHLLEHMAFKGTQSIGSKDLDKEKELLNLIDEEFYRKVDAEEMGDMDKAKKHLQRMEEIQKEAAELVIPNAYGALVSREGGVGLNAATSHDATRYFVDLPSNKLEFWFAVEAERFQNPVFRELYSEKKVIEEERRLRVENSPLGLFQQAFASKGLPNSPYGRPVIGYPEDFVTLGRKEVEAFFHKRYLPSKLTVGIVGDADPTEVEKLAHKYFGGWYGSTEEKGETKGSKVDIGPEFYRKLLQQGGIAEEGNVLKMASNAGPYTLVGYSRPNFESDDDFVLDVITDALSSGRTSRFYKNLVTPGKALGASATSTFPGNKLANMYLLTSVAGAQDKGNPEVAARSLRDELSKLWSKGLDRVSEKELVKVKKTNRVALLETMGNNRALASLLARYTALTGDWKTLITQFDRLDRVSEQEIRETAERIFDEDRCVVGYVSKPQIGMKKFFGMFGKKGQ